MYGSGNTNPPIEKAGKKDRLGDDLATSDKADASTQSQDTATPSGFSPSARPQAQRDASIASIKSGVLGHGSEEPRLHQEPVKTSQPTDSFSHSMTHPTSSELEDQSWHSERRADSGPTQTRGEDTAAIDQTSTYRSYPLATGEKTSPTLEREPSEPTSNQHSEQIDAPGREGAGLEAIQPGADPTGTRHIEENVNVSDGILKGASGISAREETRTDPGDSTFAQQRTKAESDNPYSASRLDPRVDPHAKSSNTGSASIVTGAIATSAKEPIDRLGVAYGSSAESRELSGSKTTAEHFDGSQDMSQSSQAKNALQPSYGSQQTSGPPKEEDQCETLVSTMPGAFNYRDIVVASSYHDPIPQDKASYYDFGNSLGGSSSKEPTQDHKENIGALDGQKTTFRPLQGESQAPSTSGAVPASLEHQEKAAETRNYEPSPQSGRPQDGVGKSQSALSTGEPPRAATGGAESSDTFNPSEDSDKGRNAGILGAAAGALGFGGHAMKKHAEDNPERPAAASRRESTPTTMYSPATTLGDGRYPEADMGVVAAASSRSPGTMAAQSVGAPSQSSTTKSSSSTGPIEKPYSRVSEEHFPAVGSGAQDSKTAPYSGASSQPAPMKYVTNFEPAAAAGSKRDSPTSTPNFTGTRMGEESHTGRNVAIGGAAMAGAGVLGAHEFSQHQAEKPTAGTSASTAAERPDDRHSGRGAAISSTPAAAIIAHEHSRHLEEKLSTGTLAFTAAERPGDRRFGQDTAIGGVGTAGAITHDDHRHQAENPTSHRPEDHHMSRNMAVGGTDLAGSGAVGTHEHSQCQAEKPLTGEPHSKTKEKPEDGHLGRNTAIGGAAAVGAGAVGGHEYSLRQTEREGQERLEAEKAHQKAIEESKKAAEKQQKAHEKALAKDEKKAEQAHEKVLHKEEKKAEKEHEKAAKKEEREHEKAKHKEEKKAEKEHEKAIKKEEKEHEKAVKEEEKEHERDHMMAVKMEEKKEKEHEKELAKQERQEEKQSSFEERAKKKHGLLGLFHRKRDSQDNEAEQGEDDPYSGFKTTGGTETADAAAATANQEHEKRHILGLPHHEVKNKLHKDPPPGLYSGDPATPAHADYPVQQNEHRDAHIATAGHTAASALEPERNKYPEVSGAGVGAAGTGTTPPARHNEAGEGGTTTTTTTRPRGPSAAKYGDLPQGYASQAYATDTGPSATSNTAGKDINLHSDGRRYYADGRPVDDDAAALDGSQQQQHGSEGGAGRKVLEKLHLRKGSR
jgi:hypothetical protein